MAYEPTIAQLVLFSGYDSYANRTPQDTWIWGGSTWTKQHPATTPTSRTLASMAYDPATHQLVLFGGGDNSNFRDTWNYG